MPGSSFVSGLLGGFGQSLSASRKEASDEADKLYERQNQILLHLALSPDRDIQNAALVGLTTHGPRKKGFLDNLIGAPPEDHPALGHIASLINMGREVPEVPAGADIPVHEGLGAPPAAPQPLPAGASAAMPATSGAQAPPPASRLPSPSPIQPSLASAPIAGSIPGTPAIPAHREPRQVFRTPEQQAVVTLQATEAAKQQMYAAAGATPEQLRQGTAKSLGMEVAPVNMRPIPGVVPASQLSGEMDLHGQPIDVASGKSYREVPSQAGQPRTWAEAGSLTQAKPTPVHGIATNPQTLQPDPTGKGPPASYMRTADGKMTFVGFAGARDATVPFVHTNADGSSETYAVLIPASYGGDGNSTAETPPPAGPVSGTPPPAAAGSPPPPRPTPHGASEPTLPLGTRVGSNVPPPSAPQAQGGTPQRIDLGQSKTVGYTPVMIVTPDQQVPVDARKNKVSGDIVDAAGNVIPHAQEISATEAGAFRNSARAFDTLGQTIENIDQLIRQVYPDTAPDSSTGRLRASISIGAQSFAGTDAVNRLNKAVNQAVGTVTKVNEGLASSRLAMPLINLTKESLGGTDERGFQQTRSAALAGLDEVRQQMKRQRVALGLSPHYVGEPLTLKTGQRVTVSAVHPDGSFDVK